MTTAFPWHDAPARPPAVQRALATLQDLAPGLEFRVYGSWWPTYLAIGKEPETSDVDVQIDWDGWNSLPRDTRRQFYLHEPHARYLKGLWKARSGKPEFSRYTSMLGDDGLPHGNV